MLRILLLMSLFCSPITCMKRTKALTDEEFKEVRNLVKKQLELVKQVVKETSKRVDKETKEKKDDE